MNGKRTNNANYLCDDDGITTARELHTKCILCVKVISAEVPVQDTSKYLQLSWVTVLYINPLYAMCDHHRRKSACASADLRCLNVTPLVIGWRLSFMLLLNVSWFQNSEIDSKYVRTSRLEILCFNPYLFSELVHLYQLDEFISNLRGVWWTFSFLILFRINTPVRKQNAASDKDLNRWMNGTPGMEGLRMYTEPKLYRNCVLFW